MNIVITGHKGLIGTSLKKRLLSQGHKIILEIDLRSGKDIINIQKEKLNEPVDLMIHAAAQCKINQAINNPPICHSTDANGTFEVMEFCRKNKIPKILYFSSSRVLSQEQNIYTAAKLYGENLCKGYKDSYGIDYAIVRPSTVYGPFWDETKRLVHIFIINALEGKDLEIYGNPETKTLDFTYVDDFVDATMKIINQNAWNKEFNISGGEEYNIYQLAKEIIQKTNSTSKIIVKEAETAQPQKVKVDISEIKKLGYSPKISLDEGIDKCIDFYKEHLNK